MEAVSEEDVFSADELEEGEIPEGDWHVLDQVGQPAATSGRRRTRRAGDRRLRRRHSGEYPG